MKSSKTTKVFYWIFTILLIVLMLFSAISSFMTNPDGEKMMQHIGYPISVLHLLAVGKILGVIAILVPGFPRLKEWAYAGFAYDLIGAFYAGIAAGDSVATWSFLLVGLIFVFGSYFLYHKLKDKPVAGSAVRR
jgi:uncharacterized membrane protein YphA (DoxX/SURF4 family)